MALLISLSIITLLSIALMTAFESRTVEVAHLENTLERFQAETLSRSVLRAALLTIKQQGLVYIVRYKKAWQDLPIPIQSGNFQIQEIQPIDHLFNLNQRIDSETNFYRITVFENLVKNYYKTREDGLEPFQAEMHMAISAIIDWTDLDQEGDEVLRYDYEQYPHADPEIEVKNRPFDRLSEVKLLEPFAKLNLPDQYLRDHFRVFPGDEYLDVNLADEDAANAFFDKLENIEEFGNVIANRDVLIGIMTGSDEATSPTQQVAPLRFAPPAYSNKVGESQWQEDLISANIFHLLTENEKDLFQVRTDHIRIRFLTNMGRITLNTNAIVKIEYLDSKKSLDIKNFEILSYEIHG